nr:hypothetical protein [Streptomyces sp. RG38]
MASMGILLLLCLVTAAASIVAVLLMPADPPLPLPRLCAVLALLFGSTAAAVYCHGWFSVVLGGPFPDLCEARNASGAELSAIEQTYWPLRNACLYSDATTVEHISMTVNVLVCLSAALATALTCASAALRGRVRSPLKRPHGSEVIPRSDRSRVR